MPGFPVIPERLYRESRTETGSLLDSRLQHAGMTGRGVVGMTGRGGVGMTPLLLSFPNALIGNPEQRKAVLWIPT